MEAQRHRHLSTDGQLDTSLATEAQRHRHHLTDGPLETSLAMEAQRHRKRFCDGQLETPPATYANQNQNQPLMTGCYDYSAQPGVYHRGREEFVN